MEPRRKYSECVGVKFGRLTVTGYRPGRAKPRLAARFECECECGKTKLVVCGRVVSGNTKSCGCLSRELTSERSKRRITHGRTNSPEYQTWRSMLARCYYESHPAFGNYGGRGVVVCGRWLGDSGFANFFADMGERPPGTSLDRYPNRAGNYEPGNCRWATDEQQGYNRRTNHFITWDGKTACVKEWAVRVGLPTHVLHQRLRAGWSVERALTTAKLPTGRACTRRN